MTRLPKEPLRAIFSELSGQPLTRVLWSGEPLPFAGPTEGGKTGLIVLDCIATRRVGVDQETKAYDTPGPGQTTITYEGYRVRTLEVRAENYGAEEGSDTLELVRTRLQGDDFGELLAAAGLSWNSDEDVKSIDATADNRSLSFAVFEVLLNQTVTIVEVVGEALATYINEVEAVGEGDLSRAGAVNVKGPGQP